MAEGEQRRCIFCGRAKGDTIDPDDPASRNIIMTREHIFPAARRSRADERGDHFLHHPANRHEALGGAGDRDDVSREISVATVTETTVIAIHLEAFFMMTPPLPGVRCGAQPLPGGGQPHRCRSDEGAIHTFW